MEPTEEIGRARSGAGEATRLPSDVVVGALDMAAARVEPPIDRPGLVRRSRLVRALEAVADDVPLVLIVAPPGSGKTIALSQWAAEDSRDFGWVRLDESDNDPIRLLRHVALALHGIHPLDQSVWDVLNSTDASPLAVLVPRLAAAATTT